MADLPDIVIDGNHIWVNGVELFGVTNVVTETNVSMMDRSVVMMGRPVVVIELQAESVVFGKPVAATDDIDPLTGRVNAAGAAIRRHKERQQIDVPSPTVPPSVPSGTATQRKAVRYKTSAVDDEEDVAT